MGSDQGYILSWSIVLNGNDIRHHLVMLEWRSTLYGVGTYSSRASNYIVWKQTAYSLVVPTTPTRGF